MRSQLHLNVRSTPEQNMISPAMRQSLKILQLPISTLNEYLGELILDNPLADMESGLSDLTVSIQEVRASEEAAWRREIADSPFDGDAGRTASDPQTVSELPSPRESFAQYLIRQLECEKKLPERYLPICRFLAESLNARGYLDEPLEPLSQILSVPLEDVVQALYMIQELTPTGVGARSLQECLILQLTQSHDFNEYTLAIVNQCLPLLAKRDVAAIAEKLGVSESDAAAYCNVIRRLNPIPSAGFTDAEESLFVIPEAEVRLENGTFVVRYNRAAAPRLSLNKEYESMMANADGELLEYLQKNRNQAQKLIADLAYREATLTSLIRFVSDAQREYLLGNCPAPAPLTLSEAAETLSLNVGAVSRAVKDKHIVFQGKTILLKDLFSPSSAKNEALNKTMVSAEIRRLIEAEDPSRPLTDDSIAQALASMNLPVSADSVADYRAEMGIPSTAQRRGNATESALS